MRQVDRMTVTHAKMALARAEADAFRPDADRRIWWEAHPETLRDLATLMPDDSVTTPRGVLKMLLGYPVHEARHVEPGWLALCEQMQGVAVSYEA